MYVSENLRLTEEGEVLGNFCGFNTWKTNKKKGWGGEGIKQGVWWGNLSPAINQDSIPNHEPVDIDLSKRQRDRKEEESEEGKMTPRLLRQYKRVTLHRAIIRSPGIMKYIINTTVTLLRR